MDKIRSKISKNDKTSTNYSNNNSLTYEYFQQNFLLDCLLKIPWRNVDENEMFEMCAGQIATSRSELQTLVEFKQNYSSDRAIRWYLRECFLYKLLNNSLESCDIRNLFLFRRILRDLRDEMIRRRSTTPIRVYRSQLMSTDLLNEWISSVGQCLVVKTFLSATLNAEIAQTFLNVDQQIGKETERVLIEIDADPRVIGSRPFIQLNSLNFDVEDPNEVLFCFGSIFLLNNIQCGNDGIYRIELTLYTDDENELKTIFNDSRPSLDVVDFAEILTTFDRFDEAEEFLNENPKTSRSYRILGSIALAKNQIDSSLDWFRKALEFDLDKTPMNLAEDHEQIGRVYSKIGSIDEALNHFGAALEIRQSSISSDDETIGRIYEDLARLYQIKGDLSAARSCLQRAIQIYEKISTISLEKLAELNEKIRLVR